MGLKAAQSLTPAQRRKIFAVAGELGLDNDLLHALVYGVAGKEHISDLSKKEAGWVIDELERRANRSRTVVLPTGRKVPLATKKQHWKIKQLVQQLGWEDNPKRLQGFCRKYAGVDNPRWLTKDQAWRLIEGLKSLLQREKKAGGQKFGQ